MDRAGPAPRTQKTNRSAAFTSAMVLGILVVASLGALGVIMLGGDDEDSETPRSGADEVQRSATETPSGIREAYRIGLDSADPKRPFEAFDAVSMAAVDLSGNGVKELLTHNDNNRFYVFGGSDGRIIAELSTTLPDSWPSRELAGPAIGDLTGDGRPEIVVTNSGGIITAFTATPTEDGLEFKMLWEEYLDPHRQDPNFAENMTYGEWDFAPGLDGPAFLADTNGDGKHDVFVQLDDMPSLYKLSAEGKVVWWDPVSDGNAGPVGGDLTGDGRIEVAYASDGGQVHIYDAHTMAHRCTFNAQDNGAWPASISVSPTVVDLTGDGKKEIAFGVRNVERDRDNPDWIAESHAYIFAVKHDCSLLWKKSLEWGNPHIHMHPAPVDINGDGKRDLVFLDWNTIGHNPGNWEPTGAANLFAIEGKSGKVLWRSETNTYWSNKNVAIADVTGDGKAEILVNEDQGGKDGIGLFSLGGERVGFIAAPDGWAVTKGPSMVDLDGDGKLDLLLPIHRDADHCHVKRDVGCREGAIQVYRTDSSAEPVYGNIHELRSPDVGRGSATGTFDAFFAQVSGDEWWLQVRAGSDRPIAGVDARIDGGDWTPMKKEGWGGWTVSIHIPDGSMVQFRAHAEDGDTTSSSCYQWPDVERMDCP